MNPPAPLGAMSGGILPKGGLIQGPTGNINKPGMKGESFEGPTGNINKPGMKGAKLIEVCMNKPGMKGEKLIKTKLQYVSTSRDLT
jgi:hypothetical protein